jgi:hypothetical protein
MSIDFQSRLTAAISSGNTVIVPSGPMHYEELELHKEGRRFALLVERRHTDRDVNQAKRILRNSKDAAKIQLHFSPAKGQS